MQTEILKSQTKCNISNIKKYVFSLGLKTMLLITKKMRY